MPLLKYAHSTDMINYKQHSFCVYDSSSLMLFRSVYARWGWIGNLVTGKLGSAWVGAWEGAWVLHGLCDVGGVS